TCGNHIIKSTEILRIPPPHTSGTPFVKGRNLSLILSNAWIISHFSHLPISFNVSLFKLCTQILILFIHISIRDFIFSLVTVIGVASIFISIFLSKIYFSLIDFIIFFKCLVLNILGVHHQKYILFNVLFFTQYEDL
ncbi:MAG: hypothetical protein Q8M44_03080, partial [bacterium]|nr:hypothetical protein [bacterium]